MKHKEDYDSIKNGTKVYVKNNDVNKALRKFKKKVQQERVLQDFRKGEFFEKKSEQRKRAKAAARKRWMKKLSEIRFEDMQ